MAYYDGRQTGGRPPDAGSPAARRSAPPPRRTAAARASRAIRLRGLILTIVFSGVAALFFWWLQREADQGRRWIGPGLAGPLVPAVYFATELIFGRKVPDLARSWDSLAGWQRGLIVTGVVVLCFTIILVVCLMIAG